MLNAPKNPEDAYTVMKNDVTEVSRFTGYRDFAADQYSGESRRAEIGRISSVKQQAKIDPFATFGYDFTFPYICHSSSSTADPK